MMPDLGNPRRRLGAAGSWLVLLALLQGGEVRAAGREYWLVQTRGCPQVLGADPWPTLAISRAGSPRRWPELLAAIAGRPVVVLVHGSYYSAEMAASEGSKIRDVLAPQLEPEAVVIAFDWPSQRTYPNLLRDANDKGRRAFVAGYHLARFLGKFPRGTRACLVGHSHGGLAVLAALHLLGGGTLDDGFDATLLLGSPPPLRLRAVVIAAAADRQWLDPGERLGRALGASEGVLCLFNPLDPVLPVHPLGLYSDGRRALGLSGLRRSDEARLGALASRYREINLGPLLGVRHTFLGSVALPEVAGRIGTYSREGAATARPS